MPYFLEQVSPPLGEEKWRAELTEVRLFAIKDHVDIANTKTSHIENTGISNIGSTRTASSGSAGTSNIGNTGANIKIYKLGSMEYTVLRL